MFKALFLLGLLIAGSVAGIAHQGDRYAGSQGAEFAKAYTASFNEGAQHDRIGFRVESMDCTDPQDGVYRCEVRLRMPTGVLVCGKIGVTALHIFTYRHYRPCRFAFV